MNTRNKFYALVTSNVDAIYNGAQNLHTIIDNGSGRKWDFYTKFLQWVLRTSHAMHQPELIIAKRQTVGRA